MDSENKTGRLFHNDCVLDQMVSALVNDYFPANNNTSACVNDKAATVGEQKYNSRDVSAVSTAVSSQQRQPSSAREPVVNIAGKQEDDRHASIIVRQVGDLGTTKRLEAYGKVGALWELTRRSTSSMDTTQ